jgi:hypothetical protein
MTNSIRRTFFLIFAIFFIATTPFLVIFSLGYYNFDINTREFENSLTINIDSRPRDIEVFSGDKKIKEGVGELRANSNQIIPLTIKSEGFLDENFSLWAKAEQNTTARINSLWMLPNEKDSTFGSDYIPIYLLSENLILLQERIGSMNYFIQNYSFNGYRGNPVKVENIDNLMISSQSEWEEINQNIYWDKKSAQVIIRKNGQWQLKSSLKINKQFRSLAWLNNETVLGLDTQSKLWIWNIGTETLRYFDQDFDGLAYTTIPQNIWLWKRDTVYRFTPSQFGENTNLEEGVFAISNDFRSETEKNNNLTKSFFSVKNLYQGLVFFVDSKLIYIPDFDSSQTTFIANNIQTYTTLDNTLFWIDSNKLLFSYNLYLKNLVSIDRIPELENQNPDLVKIFYYFQWRRIFIYTPTKVIAVWFDKDVINTSIIDYYPVLWIDNKKCLSKVFDRYQFCLTTELEGYKNTVIW